MATRPGAFGRFNRNLRSISMAQMTIKQALELGMQHQQAGRLSEAKAIFERILTAQPQHPDALHLLGTIAIQSNEFPEARDLIARAINAYPKAAHYHCNLGNVLLRLGRAEE